MEQSCLLTRLSPYLRASKGKRNKHPLCLSLCVWRFLCYGNSPQLTRSLPKSHRSFLWFVSVAAWCTERRCRLPSCYSRDRKEALRLPRGGRELKQPRRGCGPSGGTSGGFLPPTLAGRPERAASSQGTLLPRWESPEQVTPHSLEGHPETASCENNTLVAISTLE